MKKLPQSWNNPRYVSNRRFFYKLLREELNATYVAAWSTPYDPHIGKPSDDFINMWEKASQPPGAFFDHAKIRQLLKPGNSKLFEPSMYVKPDGSIDFRAMSLVNPPGRDVNLGVKQFWLMQYITNEDGSINEERAKEVAEQMKREYPWDLECSFSDNNEFLASILAANPTIEEDRAKRISEGAPANRDALAADLARLTEIMDSDQSTATTPDPSSVPEGRFDWAGLKEAVLKENPDLRNRGTMIARMPAPSEVVPIIMGNTSPGIYPVFDEEYLKKVRADMDGTTPNVYNSLEGAAGYVASVIAHLESRKDAKKYYYNSKRKGEKSDEQKQSNKTAGPEQATPDTGSDNPGGSQTDL